MIDSYQRGDIGEVGISLGENEFDDVRGAAAGEPEDGVQRLGRNHARIQSS